MERWKDRVEKGLQNGEPLSYWYELVKTFPGNGATAIVILMHLSFGPDYPSNIADRFKNSDLIYIKGLGILSQSNNVAAIMKDMQKINLLIPDDTVKSIYERSYYGLNPEILSTFSRSGHSIIHEEVVKKFLEEFSRDKAKTFDIINFEKIDDEFRSMLGIEIKPKDACELEEIRKKFIYDHGINFSYISLLSFLRYKASHILLNIDEYMDTNSDTLKDADFKDLEQRGDLLSKMIDGLTAYIALIAIQNDKIQFGP